jgi:hypothetical protein
MRLVKQFFQHQQIPLAINESLKITTGNALTHCEMQFFYMSPIVVSLIFFRYARN